MKWLIVGLGNPEGKYFKTYHNVGFVAVEKIAEQKGLEFRKRGNQMTATIDNLILLKPLTYMNLSGQAVVALCRQKKIAPENVVVICDDIHIEKGNIRIAFGGSSGGHNGLKSVTELLQTDKYFRVRIGIQPEKPPHNMADYVLAKLDEESKTKIDPAIERAVMASTQIALGEKLEIIQGRYNVKNSK